MKYNKWTIGLAAIGVVSLGSMASAEEKMNAVQTALSNTMLSGYVDTSAQWNPGTGQANTPAYKFGGAGKADGFNLNVVDIKISKPLDDAQWAAGYDVDLLYGPDANTYGTGSTGVNNDFAIRQAYVALRAPVGNGLDFKMGVFDSVVGYESFESGNNPNYTRSYGHTIEPQTHTGVLSTYRFCDFFAASAGIADTVGPTINQRGFLIGNNNGTGIAAAESHLTYMGSIALTAPSSWGFLEGSTLYGGVVNGLHGFGVGPGPGGFTQTSWYAGATVKTPVTGLRVGVSYDYLGAGQQALLTQAAAIIPGNPNPSATTIWADAVAGYVSFQATEKLSLHGRAEYFWRTDLNGNAQGQNVPILGATVPASSVFAATATVQYDLWANVITRLEFRWDHDCSAGGTFGGTAAGPVSPANPNGSHLDNAYMLALNVIYKF